MKNLSEYKNEYVHALVNLVFFCASLISVTTMINLPKSNILNNRKFEMEVILKSNLKFSDYPGDKLE